MGEAQKFGIFELNFAFQRARTICIFVRLSIEIELLMQIVAHPLNGIRCASLAPGKRTVY